MNRWMPVDAQSFVSAMFIHSKVPDDSNLFATEDEAIKDALSRNPTAKVWKLAKNEATLKKISEYNNSRQKQ